MLITVVEYLRSNGVAFRLVSYAAPEAEPRVAHPVSPNGSLLVDTHVLLVDGRLAIGLVARGEQINMLRLRASLGAELVEEASDADLPSPFEQGSPPPPLGRMFGAPVFVDSDVAHARSLCFAAFAPTDFIEVAYDDFARLEQPRVEELAGAGELPPRTQP
jgi:prolyl-tRNA editing enzyme YbaK/EbsC (Cys-tRNA(Pro) deacylase)